ncbi:MAG TPA: hypothetical protein VFR28_03645 [Allosphingosinicella sp.]|nr:hypothetical protein [Allosphingosinicella sp.]
MAVWISILALAAAAASATFVSIRLFALAGSLRYRWCAVLGWLAVVVTGSLLIWWLYRQAEAEAAAISQANIGIPFLYLGAWLVSLFGSLAGLAASIVHRNLKSG